MGYFRHHGSKLNIYDAPKSGGTTIRSWILHKNDGKCLLRGDKYKHPTPNHYIKLNNYNYRISWFQEFPWDSICVKRDPVERFISGYKDKILKENYLKRKISIDEFTDKFYSIMKNKRVHPTCKEQPKNFPRLPYLWYHFAPQHKQFGKNLDYYTEIFTMEDISTKLKDFLEDRWKVDLPQIHTRKSKNVPLNISEDTRNKIKEIYAEDYRLGWC